MIDEYGFCADSVTLDNLGVLSARGSAAAEARLYELADIADRAAEFSVPLLNAELSVPELLSMLSEGLILDFPVGDAALPAVHTVRDFGRMTSIIDKVRLAELYVARMAELSHPLSEADFLGEAEDGELYGYVKNQFSDEAFDVLTEELSDPRVKYYKRLLLSWFEL